MVQNVFGNFHEVLFLGFTTVKTDRTSLTQFLQHTTPMNHEKVNTIAEKFQPKEFIKGEFFLKEGNVSNEYLFLEAGYMRAFLLDTEGEEVTVNFYSPNS